MTRLFHLWRVRPALTSAFLLACALTVFFASRFVVQTVYWANHQDEPIQPWMTVGYIARSWDVDGRRLDAVAGLPLPEVKGRPQPLAEIADDRGISVEEVIDDVEAAIEALRAQKAVTKAIKGVGG